MAKRLGTVLVFKEGVSKAEAEAAVASLTALLAPGYHVDYDPMTRSYKPVPPPVHEFDTDYGGPVWYIP